jgi:hypothetical protein
LLPPAQAFLDQDFADAAAFERDLLVFAQIGYQTIQRPAGERQVEFLRIGQRQSDHFGALLGRIGRRFASTRQIVESVQTVFVKTLEPVTGGLLMQM